MTAPVLLGPVLYGAEYSVYTRIARLALLEKGVPYTLETVDIFAPSGPGAAHLARHPFARIPVLEHAGFTLYEACAITRYIDEAFPGPPLQPAGPQARARMVQAISVLDSYAFRPLVLDIYVQRCSRPVPDEALIAAALPRAARVLQVLADLLPPDAITLAHLHAAPMLAYFALAPEGAAMLADYPALCALQSRPSMIATRFPTEPA